MMDLYDFESEFEELMDRALNELSPIQFKLFKESILLTLEDYED